jgi:hypothetical protein
MKLPPTTKLEWEVKDEGDAIVTTRPAQRSTLHHQGLKRGRRWRLIVFAGALLLLASFTGVVRLVDRAERNIAQTEREIELAVEADSFLRDPAAPKPHIQSIEVQNDLAIVHLSAGEPIFYHQGGGKWERVEPNEADATARGPYRSRETDHLLFQYHQVDQSLVEAVAPAIEAFNTDLHRDIGLALPPANAKMIVTIETVASMQRLEPYYAVGYVVWESDGIVVLSPQLARSSTTLASADTLSQAVKATVAYRTILFAVDEVQPQAVWQPLVDGLQLWAYSTPREFDTDLANNMNNLLRYQLTNEAPLRLPILSLAPTLSDTQETATIQWQQSVLAKSVIDYAVATYGRHSLARLLEGMHEYDSWQSLIPAVYNVSTAEFEKGWQAYLAATTCIPATSSVRSFTNQFIAPEKC